MASHSGENLLRCSTCPNSLDYGSKTLPCLHSLCRSCLEVNFEGAKDGNVQCPECHEPCRVDLLKLSPILVNTLRRQQLDSSEWKCISCSEDGTESNATQWCKDCQQLHCTNCSRIHNKFLKRFTHEHEILELERMERSEMIKIIMSDMCSTHQRAKDSYCERCNVCLCDMCYKNHSSDSPGCSSQPLSVREEALKQKSQSPTLMKEMYDIEIRLRRQNDRTKKLTDELTSECREKCYQLWIDFDRMKEIAKQKTDELCEDIRRMTNGQVEKWRHLVEENENFLKQLKIWRRNLDYLLRGNQKDEDVVCGLRLLGSKLLSRPQKSFGLEEKCHLGVKFPKWWIQTLEQLEREKIGFVSLAIDKMPPAQRVDLVDELNLCASGIYIHSIHVNKEDDHIFISDLGSPYPPTRDSPTRTPSIMEFTEAGQLVYKCNLIVGGNTFRPMDFCSISSKTFIVVCGWERKLLILKRRINPSRLEIENVFSTKEAFNRVTQINDSLFVSSPRQVHSITKEGAIIETIKTVSGSAIIYQIHADLSSGNIWGWRTVKEGGSESEEIFSFDIKGQEIQSMKIKEDFRDFHVTEFGHLFFSDKKGIFSLPRNKMIYKFKKESETFPRIFVSENKISVSLKIDGKHLIKIFKMFH